MDDKQWHWQQFGTAWKGVGIYHVTIAVSSREPLLGTLVIPNDNPQEAKVDLSPLGEQVKTCIESIPARYPQIRILQLRMMPDHVHLLIEVDPQYGINTAVRHIKGVSSHTLRTEFPSLKSRLPTLWTNSYFVSTIGGVPLEAVKKYIENQKNV